MDARQSVVSPPFKSSFVVSELERQKSGNLSEECGVLRKESMVRSNSEGFIGVLEVYIHQARDIHNICIYQKQDVYAKLCLMSDPENTTVSTKIINGGGKNPVFNESFKLNVGTIESSLKCEVWMLSRVKNYLGDQLLGFASVPLSEILVGNGRVAQEFSLSSNDMFHSPAGFVELSLSYTGASPEVIAIPDPSRSPSAKAAAGLQEGDSELPDSISSNYDKIEFPDPKIVNENEMMVSEYFGIQSPTLDTESSESLDNSETHNSHVSENGVRVMDCFSAANLDPIEVSTRDTPASSVSTNGSPSASLSASSQSFCDTPEASKSNSDLVSATKEKNVDVAGTETETDSSSKAPSNTFAQSVLNVNIETENLVVQQDIVDMYMKSMQQFTESLAKMKLPLDIENRTTNSENENSSSDQKLQASKAKDSKVFYGSRPFF